jgi:hypothetical protein
MTKSWWQGFACVIVGSVLAIGGCTGSSLDEGIPPNAEYKPLPQPGTAKVGKPVMGATDKERKEAAAKEKGATPAPTPAP